MSITPSTMKCPVCAEQALETLTGAIGSFERCPNCLGLFIHQELIVAASLDRNACQLALDETRTLLLPIDKWCPRCLQKLADGRVQSRKVILTLCTACASFWTDLSVLGQFEEAVEKTFRLQIDLAVNSTATGELAAPRVYSRQMSSSFDLAPDSGIGRFFRSFARVFDSWADRFSGDGSRPASSRLKVRPEKAVKPVKKPLIVEVRPAAPAPAVDEEMPAKVPTKIPPKLPPEERKKEPEPWTEAPAIDIPEFVFPEVPEVEERPPPEPPVFRAPEPAPVVVPPPDVVEPEPEASVPAPEPMPEVIRQPEPVAPVAKPPTSKLVEKKPLPQPSAKRPGFFAGLKAAWSPAPKKPKVAESSISPTKPIVAPPAAERPVPPAKAAAKTPKPAGSGFFAKLFSSKKPLKRPAVPPPGAASSAATPPIPAPAEVPLVKAAEPPKKIIPIVKAPAPIIKKAAPAPKPKKEKVASVIDHLAVWPPWILGAVAMICSAFRDFGFEALPAALWGTAGWAIGFMIRLVRLYPLRPFEETDLNALAGRKGPASPVILKGRIVPVDEQFPKGEVVFRQDDKSLRLNPIRTWDIIPRLFGLSNPRQMPQGDVTLRGWYHPGTVPALEIQDIRAEKTYRKSMVRSLRWAAALSLLALAVIVSLALE